MLFSLLHIFLVGLFAPVPVAAYDCSDLPNVYTKEDLDAIQEHCKDEKILASKIYPSATWIIYGKYPMVSKPTGGNWRYFDWIVGDQKTPWRELHRICIVTVGGHSGFGLKQRQIFNYVSGNCGGSYPVDHASLYNFIDIGVENYNYNDLEQGMKNPPHAMVENGLEVPSTEPHVLHIRGSNADYGLINEPEFKFDKEKTPRIVEHRNLPPNPNKNEEEQFRCTAWEVETEGLDTCGSIVGPMFYKGEFYGMDKLNEDQRPYHHGCFTAEKVPFTDLSFLKDLRTGSDYVDRCVGKFANVVRNSPDLCPDPKTYYAYMDPDPESEIRTAYLNSEFNKKGELYVKMEFPEGINYDCVNKCTGDITDADTTSPKGRYGYACKTITGSVTLTEEKWKGKQDGPVLGEIREIIGTLTVHAEVDRNVLPNLRTIHSENDFALVLTIEDEDEFEPILPMRLTKVTSKGLHSIELKHSMVAEKIPAILMEDLKRIAGAKEKIKVTPL